MVGALTLLTPLLFGTFDSGSDGSDGAFNPQFPVVINLADAATGTWDTPSPVAGNGVYDSELWVVVFKYTTIDISGKVSVTFINHPSGAPVVWLASGSVSVSGTVTLNGANAPPLASPPAYATPGPGGFAGGVRLMVNPTTPSSGGFGPGGGTQFTHGSYAGGLSPYGNATIVPLVGGSGGGGSNGGSLGFNGGGAGGGAILVASSESIGISAGGSITANGGNGGDYAGSGGAIRLIANAVSGQGQLRARRGTGGDPSPAGDGRIRIDADTVTLTDLGDPNWTTDFAPMPVFPPSNAPTLRVVSVNSVAAPADPEAGIYTTDMTTNTGLPVSVAIEARNIPASTTVNARIVPARGAPFTVTSTPLAVQGGGVLTATATVTFPSGKSEIQLRANWTP